MRSRFGSRASRGSALHQSFESGVLISFHRHGNMERVFGPPVHRPGIIESCLTFRSLLHAPMARTSTSLIIRRTLRTYTWIIHGQSPRLHARIWNPGFVFDPSRPHIWTFTTIFLIHPPQLSYRYLSLFYPRNLSHKTHRRCF